MEASSRPHPQQQSRTEGLLIKDKAEQTVYRQFCANIFTQSPVLR